MATRQETQNKRRAMRDSIIELCRSGQMQEGDLFPTMRDLARQYGLSINLANEVIQSLVAEGVVHSRPGVGTVAGSPRPDKPGTYLFLLPDGASREYVTASYIGIVQRNFEVAIAQLGGACLTLEVGHACQYLAAGQLPQVAGIFSINPAWASEFSCGADIPRACFGEPDSSEILAETSQCGTSTLDTVQFDGLNGGRQAARHLLAAGYEKIAFLALHVPEAPQHFVWSAEREAGWRSAMSEAGKSCVGLAFRPSHLPAEKQGAHVHGEEQVEGAREAAAPLLAAILEGRVTAVIAANYIVARTLFAMLQENRIPTKLWPAVICFDGLDGMDNHVVSALNLPWDEVGKAGAQVLWERNVGRLRGPNSVQLVLMQLIPRLTCRPDWTGASSLVMPHLEISPAPRAEIELANTPY